MPREVTVLGTASQVPTRRRNHNGYLMRFEEELILIDPGEGTQRQLLHVGTSVSAITRICLTHFHGDHCLGLPGILQRMSLDGVRRPMPVAFPAGGAEYFERLRHASAFEDHLDVVPVPVEAPQDGSLLTVVSIDRPAADLRSAALAHSVPTVGWCLVERPGRTMIPERLAAYGVTGPDVKTLQQLGAIVVDGRTVTLTQVSVDRPAQKIAFVMDTGWCDGALALADGADLLVCEATFASSEAEIAREAGHLTAALAGRLAREAGARRLLITHFSQRYPDVGVLFDEAVDAFGGEVVAASDLVTVPVPPRHRFSAAAPGPLQAAAAPLAPHDQEAQQLAQEHHHVTEV